MNYDVLGERTGAFIIKSKCTYNIHKLIEFLPSDINVITEKSHYCVLELNDDVNINNLLIEYINKEVNDMDSNDIPEIDSIATKNIVEENIDIFFDVLKDGYKYTIEISQV